MVQPDMIAVQNLWKSFQDKTVLNGVNLSVPKGKIIGIFGRSGIGKSTIAKILCGTVKPDGGEIYFDGRPLYTPKTGYDRKLGMQIQMVYQQPHATLDPHQKIEKGFRELIRYHRFSPKGKELDLTEEYLAKVDLDVEILSHLPHQISGGEAQRVAIARCLLFHPKLLILDEATSMLDVSTQANVLAMIRRLQQESGGSILLISHDGALAQLFCDQIYAFDDNITQKERTKL